MGSRWVHGERHLPCYRERSRHRNAQLPRRLCRTISKSCSWPLRVLSLGSCATVKKHPVRLAVPPGHEELQHEELQHEELRSLSACGERPQREVTTGNARIERKMSASRPALDILADIVVRRFVL